MPPHNLLPRLVYRLRLIAAHLRGDLTAGGRGQSAGPSTEFHFVRDYESYVRKLTAIYPVDEAMEMAVGGSYDGIGAVERNILLHAGLQNGMSVVDLGCGSGRLAHALGQTQEVDYCGIDVVETLLDYARTKSPPAYRFILNRTLTLPLASGSADMVCAFSVFTHLHHAESFIYLQEMLRILKPKGRLIFSFLEFAEPDHWHIFTGTVKALRKGTLPHLNTFIERSVIELWCKNLEVQCEAIIDGGAAPYGGGALGQAVAILQK